MTSHPAVPGLAAPPQVSTLWGATEPTAPRQTGRGPASVGGGFARGAAGRDRPAVRVGPVRPRWANSFYAAAAQAVARGKVHWFIVGGMGGHQNGGSDTASQLSTGVTEHYTARTVGSAIVYDLSEPTP